MKKIIFQKDMNGEFEDVEIEVVYPKKKSIIINHEGKRITLKWDSEYAYPQLCVGNVILIYVNGDDFSKAYILPHLRNSDIKVGKIDVFTSELDKIEQKFEKEKQELMSMLKEIMSRHSGKTIQEINALKESISSAGGSDMEFIREFINTYRDKE